MITLMISGFLGQNAAPPAMASGASQAVPIWAGSLALFVAVFAVLLVTTIIRQTARTQERRAVVEEDEHILAVPGLGTTMADGGDAADDDDQSK